MEWIREYVSEIGVLLCEAAPYLLVGFLVAGMMKVFIPEDKIYGQLGGNRYRSVFLSSLYGVPLPLCSCSVIPTAISLKKSGASKGATASFLISTPETGVDSISVTYALMDPLMTIVRPLVAFASAVTTGSVVNWMVIRGWDKEEMADADLEEDHGHDHDHDHGHSHSHDHGASASQEDSSSEHCHGPDAAPKPGLGTKLKRAVHYAFGPLLDDLTPWFVIGFLLSGLISMLIPEGIFDDTVPRGWATSLLMLVLGTPLYICATASTPVAVALIAKGLDPGAALVFLLVGPATNITTLLVVYRFLGKKVLAIYLVGITGLALLAGAIVNWLYDAWDMDLTATVTQSMHEGLGWVKIMGGIVFTLMLVWSARRVALLKTFGAKLRTMGKPFGINPTSRLSKFTLAIVVLATYGSTCYTLVLPGEYGWVKRFGKVVQTMDEPNLYWHLPAPFDRSHVIRADEVKSVELGFLTDEELLQLALMTPDAPDLDALGRDLEAEAEMMTGDRNLLNLTYAVLYEPRDPYAYAYHLEDPDSLTSMFAESAIRQAVARHTVDDILVTHRLDVEKEATAILQGELDAIGAGIEVVSINLHEVHAPERIHFAYRDLASALEDYEQRIHKATGEAAEKEYDSMAEAYNITQDSEIYHQTTMDEATAEAVSFLALLAEYGDHEAVTLLRLYYEKLESALEGARTLFLLGDDIDVEFYDMKEGMGAMPAIPSSDPRDEESPIPSPFDH